MRSPTARIPVDRSWWTASPTPPRRTRCRSAPANLSVPWQGYAIDAEHEYFSLSCDRRSSRSRVLLDGVESPATCRDQEHRSKSDNIYSPFRFSSIFLLYSSRKIISCYFFDLKRYLLFANVYAKDNPREIPSETSLTLSRWALTFAAANSWKARGSDAWYSLSLVNGSPVANRAESAPPSFFPRPVQTHISPRTIVRPRGAALARQGRGWTKGRAKTKSTKSSSNSRHADDERSPRALDRRLRDFPFFLSLCRGFAPVHLLHRSTSPRGCFPTSGGSPDCVSVALS